MKKYIVYIMMSLILLGTTLAIEETIGTFKQNSCVNLIQTCADCSYVNYTAVYSPTSDKLLENINSTKDDRVFSYQFCNTSEIGRYVVNGVGDVEGTDTIFAYYFDVTPSGKEESDSPISLAIMIFIMVLNIGLFALFFIKKVFHKNKYVNFMVRRSLLVVAIFFTMFSISLVASLVAASSFQILDQVYFLMEFVGWIGYISVFILIISAIFQLLGEVKQDKMDKRMGDADE